MPQAAHSSDAVETNPALLLPSGFLNEASEAGPDHCATEWPIDAAASPLVASWISRDSTIPHQPAGQFVSIALHSTWIRVFHNASRTPSCFAKCNLDEAFWIGNPRLFCWQRRALFPKLRFIFDVHYGRLFSVYPRYCTAFTEGLFARFNALLPLSLALLLEWFARGTEPFCGARFHFYG